MPEASVSYIVKNLDGSVEVLSITDRVLVGTRHTDNCKIVGKCQGQPILETIYVDHLGHTCSLHLQDGREFALSPRHPEWRPVSPTCSWYSGAKPIVEYQR